MLSFENYDLILFCALMSPTTFCTFPQLCTIMMSPATFCNPFCNFAPQKRNTCIHGTTKSDALGTLHTGYSTAQVDSKLSHHRYIRSVTRYISS